MSKRQFTCLILLFFFVFGICIIIGLTGAPVLLRQIRKTSYTANNPLLLSNGSFHFFSPPMSVFQQEMWLSAIFRRRPMPIGVSYRFRLGVEIEGFGQPTKQLLANSVANRTSAGSGGSADAKTSGGHKVGRYSREFAVDCATEVCKELLLVHLTPLEFTSYSIKLAFDSLEPMSYPTTISTPTTVATTPAGDNADDKSRVKRAVRRSHAKRTTTTMPSKVESSTNNLLEIVEVDFVYQSYNAAFTYMELLSRFLCLLVSFIVTICFLHSMRLFRVRDWTIEQKWTAILLPLLLLYNNPLHPMNFLVSSWLPLMLDAIFQATFLCALLLFWLCAYHGVRVTSRRFVIFYLPKLVVVGGIWLTTVVLASWKAKQEFTDPLFDVFRDGNTVMFFEVLFAVLGVIYILFFLVLLLRAYAELKQLVYFNIRLRVLTGLAVFVISTTLCVLALRFGGGFFFGGHNSPTVKSSVAGGTATGDSSGITRNRSQPERDISTPWYRSAVEFSAFYGVLNSSLVVMAIVYSPSKNALADANFRDNPAVSMLNDSDEDVVYGSDDEESPMASGRRR